MKKLIAGNWKMNLSQEEAASLAQAISSQMDSYPNCDFVVCPAFVHIPVALSEDLAVGAQDCSADENGAHTGDISAAMIADMGCEFVIIGHSERRADHGEAEELLSKKIARAHESGLHVIYCVGEALEQREGNQQEVVVEKQLAPILKDGFSSANLTIAYEPVWAIGTGKTASTDDIEAMHSFIRGKLQEKLETASQIRILYGGSVKPANAHDIFNVKNVDGALIGGASLKAEDFMGIAEQAQNLD